MDTATETGQTRQQGELGTPGTGRDLRSGPGAPAACCAPAARLTCCETGKKVACCGTADATVAPVAGRCGCC